VQRAKGAGFSLLTVRRESNPFTNWFTYQFEKIF
jgi:hypothetical protein